MILLETVFRPVDTKVAERALQFRNGRNSAGVGVKVPERAEYFRSWYKTSVKGVEIFISRLF